MKNSIENIINKVLWLPFAIAFIGYCPLGGMDFWEAVYASIALYFVNPISDLSNPFIMAAKILAVLVTTSLIFSVVTATIGAIGHFRINRFPDSTAVYSDDPTGDILLSSMKHGYKGKVYRNRFIDRAKNVVLLFAEDKNNMDFYYKHEAELKTKPVYIQLNETDSSLLKSPPFQIRFFNAAELMARIYWKKYDLFDEIHSSEDGMYRVAIIGFGIEGEKLFRYGYMNNLYKPGQSIEYHVWGADPLQQSFLAGLNESRDADGDLIETNNSDQIIVHHHNWREDIDSFERMDRVIIAMEDSLQVLETMLAYYPQKSIHCYNNGETRYQDIFAASRLVTFGDRREFLTEDNIKNETLVRQGKLFNYDYALRYSERSAPDNYEEEMEQEWKNLDGFKRESNIARADHYWIEKKLEELGYSEKTLWELEHVRWCRFHFLNHWKHNYERDNAKRRHHLLVPFYKLPMNERKKDGIYDPVMKAEIDRLV